MRGSASDTAAPAARCRNCLRGSFTGDAPRTWHPCTPTIISKSGLNVRFWHKADIALMQCIQHLQHRNIRAVIFPSLVGRITPKVSCALSVAFTHCTNPLKILESPGHGRGDLILFEIKGG